MVTYVKHVTWSRAGSAHSFVRYVFFLFYRELDGLPLVTLLNKAMQ